MADTLNIQTTVKNPLTKSRPYGYLGYHGRTLPSKAEYSQVGDLATELFKVKRKADALQRDLLAGNIIIISTPSPILKDTVNSQIKALSLAGSSLGTVDPDWGAYTDT